MPIVMTIATKATVMINSIRVNPDFLFMAYMTLFTLLTYKSS